MSPSRTSGFKARPSGAARLVNEIGEAIRSGRLCRGDRLVPIRELAQQHGVSFGTAQKAMGQLERDGLVRRAQGSGTYVTYGPEKRTQSNTVYLLMDSREHVYGHIAASVVDELQDTPLTSVTASRRPDRGMEQFDRLVEAFRRQAPHAIVLHWREPKLEDEIARICDGRTRVIVTMAPHFRMPETWMTVGPNYEATFRMIGRHLMSLGHRRVGMIIHARVTRPERPESYREVRIGHTEQIRALGHALREGGIPRGGLTIHYMHEPWPSHKAPAPLQSPERTDRIAAWLSQPDRPTAVVGEDSKLIEVVRAAEQLGLRVPEDLAVVGLGNTPWARACDLTSVCYHEELIGKRIAEIVCADEDRVRDSAIHIHTRTDLVVRSSCGSARRCELPGASQVEESVT